PAAPVAEAAPAFEPLAADGGEPQVDEFGFAPVQISFDTLIADDEAAGIEEKIRIRFTPKPELYAKANDAIRLLRELGRLGEMEVTCDTSAVPPLGELDPEGAYLSWDIALGAD